MKHIYLILLLIYSSNKLNAQESKPDLNFKVAQKILSGCVAYADSAKVNLAIAIFNREGQLISFGRMSGASVGVSKIAQWKGLSAATYQTSSEETGKWNVSNAPDMATIPGGIPIFTTDGNFIGGVGVSGAASSVDVNCAEAGLRAAGLRSKR